VGAHFVATSLKEAVAICVQQATGRQAQKNSPAASMVQLTG